MFFLKILSRMPFALLYLLSDIVSFVLNYGVKYRRKVVEKNLKNSFPSASDKELKQMRNGFYTHFTDVFLEFFKGLTISKQEIEKRINFENINLLRDELDKDQPILLVLGHHGNWEWIIHYLNINKLNSDIVYKSLSSSFFDNLTNTIRTHFGTQYLTLLRKEEAVRATLERRKLTRILILAADQVPGVDSAHWITFLGQDTGFFRGPEKFALQLNYPVYYMQMIRVKRGFYTLSCKKIAQPPYHSVKEGDILNVFAQHLEQTITAHPSQYLWSHKRWKYQKPKSDV